MVSEEKTEDTPKVLCKLCLEGINPGAKVCPHCERHQSLWLNLLQHLATFTALVMVLLGVAQLYEARKQRIEAESVLRQAQEVMKRTVDDSKRIITKADKVLDDAKASSKEAVAASSKALSAARTTSDFAATTANDVKHRMKEALSNVRTSVEASNIRIKESEQSAAKNIKQVTHSIHTLKDELSSELAVLKGPPH
jgi:hypothetical protein